LQVVLVAGCVMIRDASTIIFLFAAQLVCVLLGFPMECALQNERLMRALETVLEKNAQVASQIEIEFSSSPQTENSVTTLDLQETANLVVQIAPQTRDALISYGRICSHRVWWLCLFASSALHVAVWYVIIIQLYHVENEARCFKESARWRDPLRIVIYGQCALFTLFAFVPPVQKIFLNRNVRDAFLYGSVAYALLSVVAKTFLGASYIAFVALFPFKTSNSTLI
jgi:hypothetical protein